MIGIGLKMGSMDTKYNTDSVGARIAWMRKQRKMTGHDLARALGVRNVYVSQIENNHRQPSRQILQATATVLNTTVGFLLMETDDPEPTKGEDMSPVYFSPEADEAAQLIDAAPVDERVRILAVVRALVGTFSREGPQEENSRVIYLPNFARRLIYGERSGERRGELSR